MSRTRPTSPGPVALQRLTLHSPTGLSDNRAGSASLSVGSSPDIVHLSQENSRQSSPFVTLSHSYSHKDRDRKANSGEAEEEEEVDFEDWAEEGAVGSDMPSDLKPHVQRQGSYLHQPLLSGDKQNGYESPSRSRNASANRQTSRFRERESDMAAKDDTRTRYTYAAIFLMISLVTFAVQTETAVYIQHSLEWNKAYCML